MAWLSALTTAEWAQLVAAVAAAVAAFGSLVTALLLWSQSRAAMRPNVSAGILDKGEGTALAATFVNAGPGLAIQLVYCLEGERAGMVGRGYLLAGERIELDLKTTSKGSAAATRMIWICRDTTEALHIWTYDERHVRLSRRRRRNRRLSAAALFNTMYPPGRLPT